MTRPIVFETPEACVEAILGKVKDRLRVGAPLGAGKPNHLLNAIYRRAKGDPRLPLTIYTALTLQRPSGKSLLERRFFEPFAARVFGDYPDLDYEIDRLAGTLPTHIRISEFYLPPGKFVGNASTQQDYISSNYTHVARDLELRGLNVAVQQVAERRLPDGTSRFSLSCNPDVAPDIIASMRKRELRGEPVAIVAQVNNNLPYMFGEAEVGPETFDFIVRNPAQEYRVFGPPKLPVSDADHMIGLYVSGLLRDGGELQVGIGAIGDAVVHALQLRQKRNEAYRAIWRDVDAEARFGEVAKNIGGLEPLQQGLFIASEMMIDGFLNLIDDGVVKRKVYDDIYLQRLLNEGRIAEHVSLATLDALLDVQAIGNPWNGADVEYLRHFGLVASELVYDRQSVVLPDGSRHLGDLTNPGFRQALENSGLGKTLKHGAVMHAGFFLGPQAFYERLRQMSDDERRLIQMRTVTRINDLYGSTEELDRLHRRDARSVNTAMMMTLLGAAVSDGLENGQVISGVGGQYNFVAMAHEIEGGRSIINLRATGERGGKIRSNIVWNYGHVTIPRHLRDLVVTEYGIADLRAKTDAECIMALLNIADSRFQDSLLQQAKQAGKIAADYRIPEAHRHNLPKVYLAQLAKHKTAEVLPAFPLGCEFTPDELKIAKALKALKKRTATTTGKLKAIAGALTSGSPAADVAPYLTRMGLLAPKTGEEKLYARLLAAELRRAAAAA